MIGCIVALMAIAVEECDSNHYGKWDFTIYVTCRCNVMSDLPSMVRYNYE